MELCLFDVVYDKWFCLSKGAPDLFAATEEMPFLLGSIKQYSPWYKAHSR